MEDRENIDKEVNNEIKSQEISDGTNIIESDPTILKMNAIEMLTRLNFEKSKIIYILDGIDVFSLRTLEGFNNFMEKLVIFLSDLNISNRLDIPPVNLTTPLLFPWPFLELRNYIQDVVPKYNINLHNIVVISGLPILDSSHYDTLVELFHNLLFKNICQIKHCFLPTYTTMDSNIPYCFIEIESNINAEDFCRIIHGIKLLNNDIDALPYLQCSDFVIDGEQRQSEEYALDNTQEIDEICNLQSHNLQSNILSHKNEIENLWEQITSLHKERDDMLKLNQSLIQSNEKLLKTIEIIKDRYEAATEEIKKQKIDLLLCARKLVKAEEERQDLTLHLENTRVDLAEANSLDRNKPLEESIFTLRNTTLEGLKSFTLEQLTDMVAVSDKFNSTLREKRDELLMEQQIDTSTKLKSFICVICQINSKSILLLPCNHLCICEKCLNHLKVSSNYKCPICRADVEDHILVYS